MNELITFMSAAKKEELCKRCYEDINASFGIKDGGNGFWEPKMTPWYLLFSCNCTISRDVPSGSYSYSPRSYFPEGSWDVPSGSYTHAVPGHMAPVKSRDVPSYIMHVVMHVVPGHSLQWSIVIYLKISLMLLQSQVIYDPMKSWEFRLSELLLHCSSQIGGGIELLERIV